MIPLLRNVHSKKKYLILLVQVQVQRMQVTDHQVQQLLKYSNCNMGQKLREGGGGRADRRTEDVCRCDPSQRIHHQNTLVSKREFWVGGFLP